MKVARFLKGLHFQQSCEFENGHVEEFATSVRMEVSQGCTATFLREQYNLSIVSWVWRLPGASICP